MSFWRFIGICLVGGFLWTGCNKPLHIHAGGLYEELAPMVKEVRLTDTVARSFAEVLHLEHETGSAFMYPLRKQVSYFEYRADATEVLNALARLPFPIYEKQADMSYHEISVDEWMAIRKTVGPYEISGASSFWDVEPEAFAIFESVKNEHHLLLVDRKQPRVLHRIARG